jgi:hypothetical protein
LKLLLLQSFPLPKGLCKAYAYEISSGSLSIFGENTKYEWYLFKKQKNGSWRDVTGTPKIGKSVTYTFHEPVLGNEFELRVFETKSGSFTGTATAKKQIAKLDLVPSSSKTPQIDKVILLNRGSKDVNKASYRDTLVAQAFCTTMFDQEVEFNLWEDDAPEGGHNPTINKNNKTPRIYKARVNEKGIAEVKIPLSSDERIMRQIANKFLMKGNKDEGKNHEYYVTASYHGKIQKASQKNVDVENPDHKKDLPKSQPQVPTKKPEPKKPISQPQKAQPKQNTPKFPATKTSTAPKQADEKARITDAYFVNSQNQKLSAVPIGYHVQVQILSKGMIGKHIQYVVWEYDPLNNDEVYRSGRIEVKGDIITTGGFKITEEIFKKGADWGDAEKQNYFIEVLPLDVSAESKNFGVTDEVGQPMEVVKSPAVVSEQKKQEEQKGICACKQYDLIWGGKVSCDFRKKVVEICTKLWPKKPMEMANGLMAVMYVESATTFSASKIELKPTGKLKSNGKPIFAYRGLTKDEILNLGESFSGAVGLIQFTPVAIDALNKEFSLSLTKRKLALMTEIDQLDYVKKYFKLGSANTKMKTPEDIYLHVFAPKGVGKSEDYVLYEKHINPTEHSPGIALL